MIAITAIGAGETANNAFDQRVFINNQFNHIMERSLTCGQQTIEKCNLRSRAWVAIKNQALVRWDRIHMLAKNFGHQFIGEKLPRLHDLIRHFADFSARLYGRAQDIAGRQLHHAIFLDEKCSLRSFACARRPQKDDIHETCPCSFRCRTP